MKLTGTYHLTAAVNQEGRRIVGTIVPYGEVGTPGLNGSAIRLEIHAGGLTWDPDNMPKLRSTHHTEPIGRAVTLDESPTGLVAAFTVARTTAGDDALTLAAEGLQAGLSIEAEAPDGITADKDGVYRLTAENPAPLTAIALVEVPAFASARVTDIAAHKESVMADQVTAAEVPDEALTGAIESLTNVVTALSASLAPAEDAPVDAARALPTRKLTGSAIVGAEPFPYGHDTAEGVSFFKDMQDAATRGDSAAAVRAEKANSMLQTIMRPRGQSLTGANEPVVRSTLVVPNMYDVNRYVEELVNPRVIADSVPGVAIDKPNPILVPAFTSSFADGGAGEPVVVQAAEAANPAQAELTVGAITVTPLLYNGLYDVSKQAVDAAAPGTDALILRTLINSYNETTEAAAVTAILANGTAGTNVTTNADLEIEARSANKAIRLEMAKMNMGLLQAPDAILFAPDVYQAAVAADTATAGVALYPFMADRFTVNNGTSNIDPSMALAVYGRPGYLAHKLTATNFVVVNWAGIIRYESPTQTFTYQEVVGPASVRFALAGYFVQRTLQAQAVRYFVQS